MNKDTFFRMNFILQDSSATTTKTYLCKMIESILFESSAALSTNDIREQLSSQHYLEFSNEEILSSIRSRSSRNPNIVLNNGKYSLTPAYASKLANTESAETLMKKHIRQFINETAISISEDDLYLLISKYLYYCFNTNKTILLSLIDGTPVTQSESFTVSNENVTYINTFLQWDNSDKNKLLYQLISYCYIYCSLNTKKDVLLSKSIFKNKHFFLDANIIFRLAGINNDDRQNTISSFVNKCKDVGIKLSFTSSTFDEVYRVIDSKVNYIKGITHSSEPLSLNLNAYGNDFYNLYIEWCKKPGNHYDDFNTFQQYLTELVNSVMNKLNYIEIKNSPKIKNRDFGSYVQSLKDYKFECTHRLQSTSSVETDVSNLLFLNDERSINKNDTLFSTNVFFISADQVLINWSRNIAAGVPLIVLPSVWLTILLRFTGRSNDDYHSFVSFMNLRTHNAINDIDIFGLIRELGFHTDDKILKEKIVSEIVCHKNDYNFKDNNNEEIVNNAFDNIRKKDNQQIEDKFRKEITNRESILLKEKEDALNLSKEQERTKNISKLVAEKISKKQRIPILINKIKYPLAVILATFLVVVTILWLYKVKPIFSIYNSMFPIGVTELTDQIAIISFASTLLVAIYGVICHVFKVLTSDEHINKLKVKYQKKYQNLLQ